MVIQTAFPIP